MNDVFIYVVLGFEKLDDDNFDKQIYGVFSTEELAKECISYITEELEFLSYCEIECVLLDEFGYR